jgi:16S rRNA (cytidine1402-2'-O)-methyltransferase
MRRTKHAVDKDEQQSEPAPAPAGSAAGMGTLYVVATPIGNLDDLTLRARAVLAAVDLIAAEDTRHTRHLLAHYGIAARLSSLHEHNEAEASEKLLRLLGAGQSVAIVSDAGTPCIADPGARLVSAAQAAGYAVVPLPGANAAVTALSVSGVEGPFLFYGFLPAKAGERRKVLESLSSQSATLVFYEAPHRVVETVADLNTVFGTGEERPSRQLVIARELTKKFETIHRLALAEAPAWLAENADRQRGEFVLVLSGAVDRPADDLAAAETTLKALLAELPLKQAVKLAHTITGAPRNVLYARALELAPKHD